MNITLSEIASIVEGVIIGDEQTYITSLSPIDNIMAQSLVFAEGSDNLKRAENSPAAAILVANTVNDVNKPIIQVANPFKAFLQLLTHFNPPHTASPGIHPSAVIAADAIIGEGVSIGPFVNIESGSVIGDRCVLKSHVHIGHQVKLGSDTTIYPHATIYDTCELGARVIIHAGTVIGSDGFGYTFEQGQHVKVPHFGKVIIQDDVEIGANTVVDRATIGATIIGEGTKIDNLVQVAHSVKLGKHNILCAFTGIAGSSTSGNHVVFAANVGVSDHVTIEDGVVLGARAGVPPKKLLKQGNIYLGNPARPKDKAIEQELAPTRIPFIRKNIQTLTERVNKLSELLTQRETESK